MGGQKCDGRRLFIGSTAPAHRNFRQAGFLPIFFLGGQLLRRQFRRLRRYPEIPGRYPVRGQSAAGAIQLTRMPRGATSRARAVVKPICPALAAA